MQLELEGRRYELAEGETVLECLERHGEQPASLCRSGVCQCCLLRAQSGDVPKLAQQGLKPAWKAQGIFMPCVCRPQFEIKEESCDAVEIWSSQVLEVKPLSPRVLHVRLSRPEDFQFEGGQFVQLVRPADGLMRSYSLASLPSDDCLELHVCLQRDGQMSQWLAGAEGESVELRGPLGECCHVTGEPDRPLLLAGTGTGLAPLWGVLRSALRAEHKAPIHIYHAAAEPAELYLWQAMADLADSHPQIRIGACIAQGHAADPRIDAASLVERVLAEAPSLAHPRVYLCGNPEFVRGLRRQMYLAGTPLDRIHADPFVPPARHHAEAPAIS
jgi:ferredoxin-NADP reductase/ferredoxin